MRTENSIVVFFGSDEVGRIARTDTTATAFQYSPSWIKNGFSISPLSLPLESRVFFAEREPFDGLFGVFNDSLPDGWGRLVTERYLKKIGINPYEITPLERLSLVGEDGPGSLRYEPLSKPKVSAYADFNLDTLFKETKQILQDEDSDTFIDQFFIRGSSSSGARPKINLRMDDKEWIVKFPSIYDPLDMGEMEYNYNRTAELCGIEVPESRLLKSDISKGFFASRRFDRPRGIFHMISLSGLLETSHREPVLDYDHLFKLSWYLSRETKELERVFRIMCFNVFSHNQDDHAKNFSFLYDVSEGKWKLSPSYDLTFSRTAWNEESTTVGGKGKNIEKKDLIELGKKYGLEEKHLLDAAENIETIVRRELGKYIRKV